jgi:hypothetical protein
VILGVDTSPLADSSWSDDQPITPLRRVR